VNRSVALISIIKLEEKKVIIKVKGSFRLYEAISIWIPKTRKKQAARARIICQIHHKIFVIMI
jgi:hypothetical protein